MNTKLISAILGTVAIAAPVAARADDAAKTDAKPTTTTTTTTTKTKKTKMKKTDGMKKDAKGGEKSCGADGKSCSGK